MNSRRLKGALEPATVRGRTRKLGLTAAISGYSGTWRSLKRTAPTFEGPEREWQIFRYRASGKRKIWRGKGKKTWKMAIFGRGSNRKGTAVGPTE